MGLLDTIFDILFGSKCLVCGKSGASLCLQCLSASPAAERESLGWIFPLYDYRHPSLKKALWLLKYKGKKPLARVFAEVLYEKMLEELSDLSLMENFVNPLLIPIPLSGKRLHERGFNQAELLCEEIIKINSLRDGLNIKLENAILIKPKETKHQAHIENRRERLRNIIGSFAIKNSEVNATKIKGRNIILIDDITTTGATLSEAKKVLEQQGARKVIAFTVAH